MTEGNEHRDVRGDVRGQIREFLTTRRGKITPEQAGLPVYGGDRRRVPGLRRSEVASLAGISPEYMTKLERGTATGVSDSVLDGLAHALQLDAAERAHLEHLLRTAGAGRPPRRRPARQRVRPTVQRILDSMSGSPAFVINGRLDILAANKLGAALYSPLYTDSAARPMNSARFVFLDTAASEFFRDDDKAANDTVALLRAEAGRDPYDPGSLRPDRAAVHPQRGLPSPLGRAQRPHPHQRHQAPLRPRTGIRYPRRLAFAGQLGRHHRSRPESRCQLWLRGHLGVVDNRLTAPVVHGTTERNAARADGRRPAERYPRQVRVCSARTGRWG
jgi:transcriptional regulator with XRE-family HTH domain